FVAADVRRLCLFGTSVPGPLAFAVKRSAQTGRARPPHRFSNNWTCPCAFGKTPFHEPTPLPAFGHPRPALRGEGRERGDQKRFIARAHVRILEVFPLHEPSFGARPVPGRSGSDSLLVPEPSPGRRLHSDPLRAGTSRAPDAGGFRGARRDKCSGNSLHDPFVLVLGQGSGAGAR